MSYRRIFLRVTPYFGKPVGRVKIQEPRNRSFLFRLWVVSMQVLSIYVVSIRTQEMKVHENFNHFKYSLRVNKNVIYSSFFKSSTWDYLHLDWINFNRNDFVFISRRPVTVVTMLLSVFLFSRQAWLQEVFPTTSCHPSVLKGVNSFSVKIFQHLCVFFF